MFFPLLMLAALELSDNGEIMVQEAPVMQTDLQTASATGCPYADNLVPYVDDFEAASAAFVDGIGGWDWAFIDGICGLVAACCCDLRFSCCCDVVWCECREHARENRQCRGVHAHLRYRAEELSGVGLLRRPPVAAGTLPRWLPLQESLCRATGHDGIHNGGHHTGGSLHARHDHIGNDLI
jgi:hypothetical protein